MSDVPTFWKRIGSAIRGQNDLRETHARPHATPMSIVHEHSGRAAGRARDRSDDSGVWKLWTGRKRRDSDLRERYAHAIDLMDAIRSHMQVQDEHTGRISESMRRIASTLEEISGAQRAQSEGMANVSQKLDAAGKHAATIVASVLEMPVAMQAQAEAVRQVARRMDAAQSTEAGLVRSLESFTHAVDEMRATGAKQTHVMADIAGASAARQNELQNVLRDQNRRMLVVCGLTSLLTIVAMIAAVAIVLLA